MRFKYMATRGLSKSYFYEGWLHYKLLILCNFFWSFSSLVGFCMYLPRGEILSCDLGALWK
jgi:hypothetical protein